MMRRTTAVILAVLVACPSLGSMLAAQGAETSIRITGAPANAALDIAMNGGKIAELKSDARGEVTGTVGLAPFGNTQVQVWVERCEDGKTVIRLVSAEFTMPQNERCRRDLLGIYWLNRGRALRIDLARGVITGRGVRLNKTMLIAGAGGVGLLGVLAAAGGGGSTSSTSSNTGGGQNQSATNPQGNYTSSADPKGGELEHVPFINLARALILLAQLSSNSGSQTSQITSGRLTISGPAGSNWVTVSGTIDSTGRFSLTGAGTVAGRSNVSVRFDGTINESGRLTGDLTMGAGGELPGGRSTIYGISGQKQ